MNTIWNCLAVAAGGAVGSVCRYLLGLLPVKNPGGFPVVTLCINVSGAFLIGILAALALRRASFDPRLLLFLKVGICGGFTTFSTFSLETAQLLQSGKIVPAALYVTLSVLLGAAAVFGAEALVR